MIALKCIEENLLEIRDITKKSDVVGYFNLVEKEEDGLYTVNFLSAAKTKEFLVMEDATMNYQFKTFLECFLEIIKEKTSNNIANIHDLHDAIYLKLILSTIEFLVLMIEDNLTCFSLFKTGDCICVEEIDDMNIYYTIEDLYNKSSIFFCIKEFIKDETNVFKEKFECYETFHQLTNSGYKIIKTIYNHIEDRDDISSSMYNKYEKHFLSYL